MEKILKFKKTIRENGIVISKTLKKAFDGFTNPKTGEIIKGQPERYVITVISSEDYLENEFDETLGMVNFTKLDYSIETLEEFEKYKFNDNVRVKYELSENGAQPIDISLINEKKVDKPLKLVNETK